MTRDRSSVAAVSRVQRLDGSARVVAIRRDNERGWETLRRPLRLTPDALLDLRRAGVLVVRLRRHLHVGDVPLAWFGAVVHSPARTGS